MSFIPTLKYTKTLMLGETYDFGSIQAELSGFEIDSIEATWLNNQSPKEMGYHPVQVKVVATTGEIFETTIQVFVYTKPFDGHRKFVIFTYQGAVKLMSFDCHNGESNALYLSGATTAYLREINTTNCYAGSLGYTFNTDTKEWDYDTALVGRYYHKLPKEPNVDDVLYSNLTVYKHDKKTVHHVADPVKEDLPYWTPACNKWYRYEYKSVMEYDPTIEAYFVIYNRLGTEYGLTAYCFKNLNGQHVDVTYRASGSTNNPSLVFAPSTLKCTVLIKDHKDPEAEWKPSFYENVNASAIPGLANFTTSAAYGITNVMNSLHEIYNVDFNVCDKNYENNHKYIDHKKATPAPEASPESVREAKYRMKNDTTGDYDVVHFETNVEQIVGFSEKHNELTQALADQYNKAETIQMFDLAHEEVADVESITNALNDRLIAVNQEQEQVAFDLTNEVVRATTEEQRLQDELDRLGEVLEVLPSDLLAQSNHYTDEKVLEVRETLAELESQLGGQSSDLVTRLDEIETTINHHHEAFGETSAQLNAKLDVEDGRIDGLHTAIESLRATDKDLETDIAKLKQHLTSKGNDTLIFATQAQFEAAELEPKIGDLVFVLETRRAWIATETGFILFDEITTTEDLTSYILKSDVTESMTSVESLLNTEVERATTEEGQLASHLQGVVDIDTLQGQTIHTLEQTTTEHQSSIDGLGETRYKQAEVEAIVNTEIEKQMAIFSSVEPIEGRCGHVWLEEIAD